MVARSLWSHTICIVLCWSYSSFLVMTPDTYTFSGDIVTFLGLVGVASTFLIVVTAFRRFFNSPYNLRVTPKQPSTKLPTDNETPVS